MIEQVTTMLHGWFGPEIDWKQVILIAMSPLFLIAFAIEFAVMRGRGRREPFELKDILANLNLGGAYQVFEIGAFFVITAAAVDWFWQHRLFEIPVTVWTIGPIFIGVELCYYAFHRTSHRVR